MPLFGNNGCLCLETMDAFVWKQWMPLFGNNGCPYSETMDAPVWEQWVFGAIIFTQYMKYVDTK
jgi:hypothetical protein